nr:histidine phosphatase family protein [Shewanella pneumatophori]
MISPTFIKLFACTCLAVSMLGNLSFAAQVAVSKPTLNKNSDITKVVLLVRHAEKNISDNRDPKLSPTGIARSQALAKQLSQLELSQLIASDYQRTQLTLAPIAKDKALNVTIAATKSGLTAHVNNIVALVNKEPGNSLIAGHSNTLPMIISALGGPTIKKISESTFGELYQLDIKPNAEVVLSQSHFGQ